MLLTIIAFIVILGILVLVHELGHFLTAKRAGVKVDEFGFGFPPRVFGVQFSRKNSQPGLNGQIQKRRWFLGSKPSKTENESNFENQTIYSFNLIPLGGFVRIKGESGENREDPDSFSGKPFRTRGLILSAGVLMNIFLAFLLLSVGFMRGLPTVISEDQLNSDQVKEVKIQIASIAKDSPAEAAGLLPLTEVVAIDGQSFAKITEMQQYIREHQENKLSLSVKQQSELKEIQIQPSAIEGSGEDKVLGVTLAQTGIIKYGFFNSIAKGAEATVSLLLQIIIAFFLLIKNLIVGAGVSADLAGPVGVAVLTGQVVDLGFSYILQFTALLSLNLAIINFLPFPALDGGRFFFLVIEKLRRKPNNQQIENIIHNIGFSLLMILVVIVTYRDIIKYGGNVIDKIKNLF